MTDNDYSAGYEVGQWDVLLRATPLRDPRPYSDAFVRGYADGRTVALRTRED